MNTRKKSKEALPCPDYDHPLPKALADALHQKNGERYTKFDAFRDLMERQAIQDPAGSGNGTPSVNVTVTELSVDWGWHRHTVTAFLEKLASLGYLTVEKLPSSFNLCLTSLSFPAA